MQEPAHVLWSDLRGVGRLATDATLGLADLVEAMHHTIATRAGPLGKRPVGRTSGITGFVYRSVRGATRIAGLALDGALGLLAPLVDERPSSERREAVVAALNGLFGDHLAASGNPLAIEMGMRADGSRATGKVVVLVHGLCMNDRQWNREGHDHGAALARDLGYAPVYLRYNTGRPVEVNGRELAQRLEGLLRDWPRRVGTLAIVGHSMGGLVARSACRHAALAGHAWLRHLDDLVFLGTPHLGAPLERAGSLVDLLMEVSPYSAPFARLGKARSAGIKDLSHGMPQVALPRGVRCHAIAASAQERPGEAGRRIRGDGLVPVASALGELRRRGVGLGIPAARRWVAYGMGHFDLLSRPEVYERVKAWLGERG